MFRSLPNASFRSIPVEGFPAFSLPAIVPLMEQPGDGLAHAWAICYSNLLGLHSLYGRMKVSRPLGRLHDLTVAMYPLVSRVCGQKTLRACLSSAYLAVEDIDFEGMEIGQEAQWWQVALQSSMALAVWYDLVHGAAQADVDFASHVSCQIRRILDSVYEARAAGRIHEAACGDSCLLAQVAENSMVLGAQFQGMPE